MKKALVILMALAMVFAAFADDPAWNFGITKFDGSAELDYIIDLDAETTGMANVKSDTAIEFTLISKGEKVTTGDGLWGELKIEGGEVKNGFGSLGTAAVKTAKIHLVDGDFAVAVDILGPNLEVGGGDAKLATRSAGALPKASVALTDAAGFTVEITAKDVVEAKVSFADNGEKKSDAKKFALKAEATIKAIPDANIYGGVAWSQEEDDIALAAKADFTIGLSDSLKLIPSAGFAKKGDAKELTGAVLLNWGAVDLEPGFAAFSNYDADYWPLLGGIQNKTADGVSVAVGSEDLEDFTILVGAYDSTFVEGLKVGAQFVTDTSDNPAMVVDAAAKYETTFGIFKFAANAGFELVKIDSLDVNENGLLWGASIETDEIIQNTTLKAAYAGEKSADIGGKDADGKITLSAKIHF